MKRRFRLSVVAIALAVVVGCQGAPDQGVTPLVPSSSGSHSPSASASSATPTPSVSTPSKQELLAEAEKTYRAYLGELLKLEAMGGSDNLTPGVDQFLMEPYREAVRKTFAGVKADGSKMLHTDRVRLVSVKPIDANAKPNALVAISTCVDYSKAIIHEYDGSQHNGIVVLRELYFKRDSDGQLKMFAGEAHQVSAC